MSGTFTGQRQKLKAHGKLGNGTRKGTKSRGTQSTAWFKGRFESMRANHSFDKRSTQQKGIDQPHAEPRGPDVTVLLLIKLFEDGCGRLIRIEKAVDLTDLQSREFLMLQGLWPLNSLEQTPQNLMGTAPHTQLGGHEVHGSTAEDAELRQRILAINADNPADGAGDAAVTAIYANNINVFFFIFVNNAIEVSEILAQGKDAFLAKNIL
jgi:hypothetical protein